MGGVTLNMSFMENLNGLEIGRSGDLKLSGIKTYNNKMYQNIITSNPVKASNTFSVHYILLTH